MFAEDVPKGLDLIPAHAGAGHAGVDRHVVGTPLAALPRFLGDRLRITASTFKLTYVRGDGMEPVAWEGKGGSDTVADVARVAFGPPPGPGAGWEDPDRPLVVLYRT
jgi:hypothetical protein